MAEDLSNHNNDSALSGRNDKTRHEHQHHQELEAILSSTQTSNDSDSRHRQETQDSLHLVAQHQYMPGNRDHALSLNPRPSKYLSPYHHDSSTSDLEARIQDFQDSLMFPRMTSDSIRFGSEATVDTTSLNMIIRMRQAARPWDTQQSSEFQTSFINRIVPFTQNMMAPPFHKDETSVQGHLRVGDGSSNMMDRKFKSIRPVLSSSKKLVLAGYHQQKSSYVANFMEPNHYQQQPKASCTSSPSSSRNSTQVKEVEQLQYPHRKSNSPPQYSSTLTTASDMVYGDNEYGEASQLESLADLVRASEPDICKSIHKSNPGPIKPPRRVEDLKIAFDNTSNSNLQIPTSGNEFLWRSNIGSRGFQASTSRDSVSGLSNNVIALQLSTRNDIARDFTTSQNQYTISQTQGVPESKFYEERARSVDGTCWNATSTEVKHVADAIQSEIEKLANENNYGPAQHFRPSNSVLRQRGLLGIGEPQLPASQSGYSKNYQGDITIAKNRSAEIAGNENCAVWVIGLPGNVTHRELLGAIRNTGKIYCAVINLPTGKHQTAAAKIVFFERYQAEKFMALAVNGRFQVMGQQVRHVRWNKIKSARYPYSENSRVIHITGPRYLMDFGFFEEFFTRLFEHQLEGRQEVECSIPGMVTHEWRFGSLRSQAASAKTAIERELRGVFTVKWARDPCM